MKSTEQQLLNASVWFNFLLIMQACLVQCYIKRNRISVIIYSHSKFQTGFSLFGVTPKQIFSGMFMLFVSILWKLKKRTKMPL